MDIYEQLRRDEGVRLKPYTDTVGKLTIGVGRNLTDDGISEAEADSMLHNDVADTENMLTAHFLFYSSLDSVRQGVLLNMAFNMGVTKLAGFTQMLRAVASGDWDTAAKEMMNSKWAEEVGDRATRLRDQLLTGVWV